MIGVCAKFGVWAWGHSHRSVAMVIVHDFHGTQHLFIDFCLDTQALSFVVLWIVYLGKTAVVLWIVYLGKTATLEVAL